VAFRRRRPVLAVLALGLVASVAGSTGVAGAAADRDGDGLPDRFERGRSLTSTTLRDTDGDGVGDGSEDCDADRPTLDRFTGSSFEVVDTTGCVNGP
jgi:hypothetical protein